MISLTTVAYVILYLIIGAIVFGLLWWAVQQCGSIFGPGSEPFIKVAKVLLILLAVFVVIGVLLQLLGGVSIIRV